MDRAANFENHIRGSIEASIAAKEALLADPRIISILAEITEILVHAFRHGYKALFFGNGGSATDAQHMAAELVGRFAFDRPALPALSLAENPSAVTAISNDLGFEQIFSRQFEAFARPGDVAIAISTSGNSANVLRGVSTAKKIGAHTIALTGMHGGKLKQSTDLDLCLCVPSNETPRIQECHVLIGHIVSELVEEELFHGKRGVSGS
ncbi:MAG: SIS domain-containing protein [Candidatus Acidiferrum sp.]